MTIMDPFEAQLQNALLKSIEDQANKTAAALERVRDIIKEIDQCKPQETATAPRASSTIHASTPGQTATAAITSRSRSPGTSASSSRSAPGPRRAGK